MSTLFLEGDRFVGKSTLLKKCLKEKQVSGFYVERKLDESGKIIGFELKSANPLFSANQKTTEVNQHWFIRTDKGQRYWDISVFQQFGCELLTQAAKSPDSIVLLDEIGGIELLSEEFMAALVNLLQQKKKIVGVFKSEKNYQQQKRNMQLSHVDEQRKIIKQLIEQQGQLLTLTKDNQFVVGKKLKSFLAK